MTMKSITSLFAYILIVTGVGQSELDVGHSYPPGYMRREPLIHQTAVEQFHTEGTIKVANQRLFKMKADIANYYHLENTDELEVGVSRTVVSEDQRHTEHVTTSLQAEGKKKKWWHLFQPIEY